MAFASTASDLRWQIPVSLVLGGVLVILGQRVLRRAGYLPNGLNPQPLPPAELPTGSRKTHGDPGASQAAQTGDRSTADTTVSAIAAEPAPRRRPNAPTKTKTAKRNKRKSDDASA